MGLDLAFRDADPLEDDELARIMYNSFLLTCLNRAHKGDVVVAYTTTVTEPLPEERAAFSSPGDIAAVVLLLPPHARPQWSELLVAWRTGFLQGLFGLGLRGVWRGAVTYEGSVNAMIAKGLKAHGIANGNELNLVFVQTCVRNPEWEGQRGPARQLLDWAIHRWWERHRQVPVWLDCFSDDGENAYTSIGFDLLGTTMIETECDAHGIVLKAHATEEERENGRRATKQRVMVRVPDAKA